MYRWGGMILALQDKPAVQDKSFCPAFFKKLAAGGRCSFGD